ncbi:MAG: hypothetical protein AB7E47_12980 [Desulfovibrionaceae bacterium]
MNTVHKVHAVWGAPLDWVIALAERCDAEGSQRRVGALIGYSSTTINLVLNNTYKGSLQEVERRVRAIIMRVAIDCPLHGEISGEECSRQQARPASTANAARVREYATCQRCEHRLTKGGGA